MSRADLFAALRLGARRRQLKQRRRQREAMTLRGNVESLEDRIVLAASNTPLDLSLQALVPPQGVTTNSVTAPPQWILSDPQGRVGVTITGSDVATVLPGLVDAGLQVTAALPDFHMIEGFVSTSELEALAAVAGVGGISPTYRPITSAGSIDGDAVYVHEADRVIAELNALGVDGSGVRVGVLSNTYDQLGDAAANIASGDLPSSGVTVIQDTTTGSSIDEGRAMLQLIHDIAPGATLGFATAFTGQSGFANNIRALADSNQFDADIIVDDVGYLTAPFFQDGLVAQAVEDVFANDGVAYFSSAGNAAGESYESDNINFSGNLYDFDPGAGTDTRQLFDLGTNGTIQLSFQWDDPFFTLSGVDTDLDINLYEAGTNTLLASSLRDNIGGQSPYEFLEYTGSGQVELEIVRSAGPNPGRVKWINFGTRNIVREFATNSSTVFAHSAAANGRAVAAAPYFEHDTAEGFSSFGPTTILFDASGNRLSSPVFRQTPQITATDGTENTFFGQLADFDGDGNSSFYFFGTSAAAPNAAAVAALLKDAEPTLTAQQIYDRLENTATDIGAVGFDNVTGHGLVNAWDAIFPSGPQVAALSGGVGVLTYSEDFENGFLSREWETNSNGGGRIRVVDNNASQGTQRLSLDAASAGFGPFSLNEAILHLDLDGMTNVQLNVDYRDFGDEDHAMSENFTGSENSDGIAISVDGVNWHRVVSMTGGNISGTGYGATNVFGLSAIAANAGITLGSHVRIKFQQYDNFAENAASPGSGDGIGIDNITITASGSSSPNTAPTIDVTPATALDFTEDDGPTILFPTVTITDGDDTNLTQAVVQITGNYNSGSDVLAVATGAPNTITIGSFNSSNGSITLSGTASIADYVSALKLITFDTTTESDASSRTITVTITDENSLGASNGTLTDDDTRDVTVTLTNDAPVLDVLPDTALDYASDVDGAVQLFTGGGISENDDAEMTGLTVQITSGYDLGSDVLALSSSLSSDITFDGFNSSTGTLSFSGLSSIANYLAALQLVTFETDSTDGTARVMTVTVTDANASNDVNGTRTGSDTRTVNVTPPAVNAAPVIDVTPDTTLNFTEDDGPTALFTNVTITDEDDTNLTEAVIEFVAGYLPGVDVLGLSGSLPGTITTTGFNSTDGTLTLTGTATIADYVTALKLVTFDTTQEGPGTPERIVRVTITDANSEGASNGTDTGSDTRNVDYTPINDVPQLDVLPDTALDYAVSTGGAVQLFNGSTLTDNDDFEMSQVTITITGGYDSGSDLLALSGALPDGITTTGFNSSTGGLVLTGAADIADYLTALGLVTFETTSTSAATRTVTVTVTDANVSVAANGTQPDNDTRTVNVTPANTAPTLNILPSTPVTFTDGDDPVIVFEDVSITDADDTQISRATVEIVGYVSGSDVLSASSGNGVNGSFDANTGIYTFSGDAVLVDYELLLQTVRFTTSDVSSPSTRTLVVTITDANVVGDPAGTQTATDSRSVEVMPTPLSLVGFDPDTGRFWTNEVENGTLDGEGPGLWNQTRTYVDTLQATVENTPALYTRDAVTGIWYVSRLQFGLEAQYGPEQAWGQWEGFKANPNTWRDVIVGDFDGSSFIGASDDVLGLTNNGGLWVMTANADGTGFDEEVYVGGLLSTETWVDLKAFDVNFDGIDDIVARSERGGGWYVAYSNGNTFDAPVWVQAWDRNQTWVDVTAIDVNGDESTDLIGRSQQTGEWVVMLADGNGTGFLPEQVVATWNPATPYTDIEIADFDGDLIMDIIARDTSTGEWRVMIGDNPSIGVYTLSAPTTWATWNGWRLNQPWINTTFADYDGDGRTDLVTQAKTGGAWWMMLANDTGTGFEAPVVIDIFSPNDTFDELYTVDINGDIGSIDANGLNYRMDLVGLSSQSGSWWIAESDLLNPADPYAISARPSFAGFDATATYANIGEGDFNGDGETDLLARNTATGAWWVLLAGETASGYLAPQRWEALNANWQLALTWDQLTIGDVNGDGKDDVIIRNSNNAVYLMAANASGTGFVAEAFVANINPNITEMFLMDVNGDGRDDLVNYNANTRQWYYAAARSNQTGFWRMFASDQWRNLNWGDIQVGDVDGDGKEDVIGRVVGGNGMYVMRANNAGTGFESERWVASFPFQETLEGVLLTDVNGDGRDDLVARSRADGEWHVMIATGNPVAMYSAPTVWSIWTGWKVNATWDDFLTADVNFDGNMDIVARTASGGWWLMLANSTGTAFETETFMGSWPSTINWTHTSLH